MGPIVAAILKNLLIALVTDKVIRHLFIGLGEELAPKTTNKLDDRMVIVAAEALDVPTKLKLD